MTDFLCKNYEGELCERHNEEINAKEKKIFNSSIDDLVLKVRDYKKISD